MIQREADFATIQESSTCADNTKISKPTSSSTTSWSRLKDPRIVRVSRAFGGKDRHSKVCTVRGLRDRRVRLSVPTAIQLYDLQDRLGLNQPSKVVDWLLNAAKHEIDELPPLQIPQGGFSHNLQTSLEFGASPSNKQGPKISGSTVNWNDTLKSSRSNIFWGKSKDVSGEASDHRDENWARNEEERQYNMENQGAYVSTSTNCAFTRQIPSSLPSFLNSSTTPYNPFVRWDPSNLTLSQPTRSHGLTDQTHQEDLHNFSLMPIPSTLSVPSGSHQVLVYQPSAMATQSYFPSQIAAMNAEFDPKQLNYNSHLSNSSLTSPVNTASTTQPVRTFHFSMTANLLPSQNNAASDQHKNNEFHLG